MLGKSQAEPKLHGLPEGFRGCLKESQLILKIRGKSSWLGGNPVQSTGMEISRAMLQTLKSGKGICGNRDGGKGMAPSD